MDELRERIIERLFGTRDRARIPTLALGDDDWRAARELRDRKYGAWEWNYGENPPSNVQRARRFTAGEIDARLDVKEGRLASVRLFGDFMGRRDVGEVEALLLGVPHTREAVEEALAGVELRDYFGDIPREDVLALIAP